MAKVTPPPPQSDDDRAKIYGFAEADLYLTNLVIGEEECVRLSGREDSPHSKSVRRIPVKSVADLKQMIGVPDAVALARCRRCPEGLTELPAPTFNTKADLTPGQIQILRTAAEEYIHGNSALVSQFQPVIDSVIKLISNAYINLIFYQDITVERNAVLTIDPSISVLYANTVLIKRGGSIRVLGRIKMDFSTLKGEPQIITPFPGGVSGTLTR
jgi:hypothetical protein